MRKFKIFMSFYKERDWLEEMARKGYVLENITFGVFYQFKECEPCEKVYEIERFAMPYFENVSRADLTARKTAFDIAAQTGWQVAAYDETLNYYFVKDHTDDESDEFYDDEESRRLRAEKFRKFMVYDNPMMLLQLEFVIGLIYILFFLIVQHETEIFMFLSWLFIGVTVFECGICIFSMYYGNQIYEEFLLSRKEWQQRKKYSEKKKFKNVKAVLDYLEEKDRQGLCFEGSKDSICLFKPSMERFSYYADTCQALKKRLKKAGKTFQADKKDFQHLGMKWQELSMEEAAQKQLEPVCCMENGILIYRRNKKLPSFVWENGAQNSSGMTKLSKMFAFISICGVLGGIIGLMVSIFGF